MHDDLRPSAARRMTEEAAQWLLANREGLDEAGRAAFLAWLRHSPAHVGEYMAMVQWDQDMHEAATRESLPAAALVELAASEPAVIPLHPLRAPVRTAPEAVVQRRATHPRRWPWITAAAAVVVVATVVAWRLTPAPRDTPGIVYSAPADTTRSLTLDDGSRLQLDRGSVVRVRFDAARRDIAVIAGTMLIDVGHGSKAPLSVTLGSAVLRDIGTVFQVRNAAGGGEVTVLSGQVDVSTSGTSGVVAHLHGGQRAAFAPDGSVAHLAQRTDLAHDLAWLPAEIDVRDVPVADVARRFNDYGQAPLLIEDDTIGASRISGRFHPRDPAGFVAYLKTLPGVRVHRDAEGVHVRRL